MGRISMPMMNKTGYSMYWNSMWDDKLNYTRTFKEDILLKVFFNLFVEGGYLFISRHKLGGMENYLKMLKIRYNLHFIKKRKDETHFNYFLDVSKNSQRYLSRVWLFKYQSWVIFYFFTYTFSSSKFFKKKKQKKPNKQYFNLLHVYYYNLLKIDYDYNMYNKYNFNKLGL